MGIIDRIQQLSVLEDNYKAKRAQVIDAIVETIKSIGQNPNITPVGSGAVKAYTINFSSLFGAPWSPAFHDWEVQAELLIGLLMKKPVDNWVANIQLWSDKKLGPSTRSIIVDKTQLNKEFLQEVSRRF